MVELMVTLVIAAIVTVALYSAYVAQNRNSSITQGVSELQQNIRAGLELLTTDLRLAGYDPTRSANTGFVRGQNFTAPAGTVAVTTDGTNVAFTADLDGNGSVNTSASDVNGDGRTDLADQEQIAYRFSNNRLQKFSVTSGAVSWQTVAENIENMEFRYLKGDGTVAALPGEIDEIRMVTVSILGRTSSGDPDYLNTDSYTAASGTVWGPYNDNVRRRLLIMTVQCRNMGL